MVSKSMHIMQRELLDLRAEFLDFILELSGIIPKLSDVMTLDCKTLDIKTVFPNIRKKNLSELEDSKL